MFKGMKLGTKILGGFGILIILALGLGGLAVVKMKGIESKSVILSREYVPETLIGSEFERNVFSTMFAIRAYGYTGEKRFHEEGLAAMAEVKETLKKAEALAAAALHLTQLKASVGEAAESMTEYDRLIRETEKNVNELAKITAYMQEQAEKYMSEIEAFTKSQNEALAAEMQQGSAHDALTERLKKLKLAEDIRELGNAARIANLRSQAQRDNQHMAEGIQKIFPVIEKKLQDLSSITRQAANQQQIEEIRKAAANYKVAMQQYSDIAMELERLNTARVSAGYKAMEISKNLMKAAIEQTSQIANSASDSLGAASTTMLIGLSFALILGIALALVLTRSITAPLRRIIDGLGGGADQVASASGQVSSTSQSLAEGASQQAAAIEETSSSLEEMSSMTRQNADNARQANTLMSEARQVVETANVSMERLTGSMTEISQASEETSKIIKTIDEIAFQTNLLALNAAVEAARAGEAGAGFAVVADEVRNLALRAAEAAKNTASLIEGTVKKVKDGSSLVAQTNEAFQQVANASNKAAELVGEISAASSEQAQGIDQINRAVTEMDKVTQQNAASAEESASASEEMNAQAETMKDMVGELVAMVGGTAGRNGKEPQRSHPVLSVVAGRRRETPRVLLSPKKAAAAPHAGIPRQAITFEEESFEHF